MIRATDLAHLLLRQTLKNGDWAVDATVGNGHDTLFLAEQVGPAGRVFGFDIQGAAIDKAGRRLAVHPQATLFHAGHERLAEMLPDEARGRLAAVMFNLGYLPGSDKQVVTTGDNTVEALGQALDFMRTGGVATVVLYPGHAGGAEEAGMVSRYFERLPSGFSATRHERIGSPRAPVLLAVKRIAI